MMIILHVIIRL